MHEISIATGMTHAESMCLIMSAWATPREWHRLSLYFAYRAGAHLEDAPFARES
jgi:hypothetical protein